MLERRSWKAKYTLWKEQLFSLDNSSGTMMNSKLLKGDSTTKGSTVCPVFGRDDIVSLNSIKEANKL